MPFSMRNPTGTCPRCGAPRDREDQGYCRPCHAAYMRENRKRYSELSDEQRQKAIARAYARTYQRRGRLAQQPCEGCGGDDAQKHHDDYSQPLSVRWLCQSCHAAHHLGPVKRFSRLSLKEQAEALANDEFEFPSNRRA